MTIEIYGASDDLIEVKGDINEEFDHYSEGPAYLAMSDGTLLQIQYDASGIWRIHPIRYGTAKYEHTLSSAPAGDDAEYSDRVVLTGDIKWIVCGDAYALRGRK